MTARITVEGNLGSTPELRVTENGMAIATFRLASTKRVKNQDGTWSDGNTSWYRVSAFRTLAEAIIDQAYPKGTKVVITGNLEISEWTDKEGNKRHTPEIAADTFGVIPKAAR